MAYDRLYHKAKFTNRTIVKEIFACSRPSPSPICRTNAIASVGSIRETGILLRSIADSGEWTIPDRPDKNDWVVWLRQEKRPHYANDFKTPVFYRKGQKHRILFC